MKNALFISIFLVNILFGQQKIYRTDIFEKTVLTQTASIKKYIPLSYINGVTGSQDLMKANKNRADFYANMILFFENNGLKLHKLNDSFLDNFTFFASKSGEIEMVTFGYRKIVSADSSIKIDTLKSYNFDVLEANLSKFIAKNQLANDLSDRPFQISFYVQIGKVIKTGEGINTIEQLEKVSDFSSIKNLSLDKLYLESFPEIILKCKNLEALDLSENLLKTLPKSLWKLKKLRNVNLKGNPINHQKLIFKKNKHLLILNLQQTKMSSFNRTLKRNKNLEMLLLSKNNFEKFKNKDFKGLKNLRTLNLYDVNLKQLPAGIKHLKLLEELDLYHNHLRFLPKEIGSLTNLVTLAISFNELWKLPQEIKNMENLKVLYAHHNKLDYLAELPNLTHLDIGYNDFKSLPESVLDLKSLSELDCIGNKFRSIPNEILKLENLKKVFINNNDFFKERGQIFDYKLFVEKLKAKNIEVF